MKKNDIQQKLLISLKKLLNKDKFLLQHDISERAISHKLATYVENEFVGFDVDCEYNGYVESDNNRKYIKILKSKAEELGIIQCRDGDNEIIYRAVYPDIIVHQRGSNVEGSNLLIIEIKKSTSDYDSSYDMEKLCRYTSTDYENNLNYKLGAFILLNVQAIPTYKIFWYEDGNRID